MVIYLVYQQYYADFENGEDDTIFIEQAYKNKRKAIRKAKELMNKAKKDFYIDNDIKNVKNPFKKNTCVDFYKNDDEQDCRVSSIVMEETRLVA